MKPTEKKAEKKRREPSTKALLALINRDLESFNARRGGNDDLDTGPWLVESCRRAGRSRVMSATTKRYRTEVSIPADGDLIDGNGRLANWVFVALLEQLQTADEVEREAARGEPVAEPEVETLDDQIDAALERDDARRLLQLVARHPTHDWVLVAQLGMDRLEPPRAIARLIDKKPKILEKVDAVRLVRYGGLSDQLELVADAVKRLKAADVRPGSPLRFCELGLRGMGKARAADRLRAVLDARAAALGV